MLLPLFKVLTSFCMAQNRQLKKKDVSSSFVRYMDNAQKHCKPWTFSILSIHYFPSNQIRTSAAKREMWMSVYINHVSKTSLTHLTHANKHFRSYFHFFKSVNFRYYDVASPTDTLTREEVAELNIRRDYSLVVNAVRVQIGYPFVRPYFIIAVYLYVLIVWFHIRHNVCLCWGLTSQSTIFQSCRDGATASWVINQYFRGVKCLAQGHNTAAVGIEPPTSRSGVRHSTTEPPRSPFGHNVVTSTGSYMPQNRYHFPPLSICYLLYGIGNSWWHPCN